MNEGRDRRHRDPVWISTPPGEQTASDVEIDEQALIEELLLEPQSSGEAVLYNTPTGFIKFYSAVNIVQQSAFAAGWQAYVDSNEL